MPPIELIKLVLASDNIKYPAITVIGFILALSIQRLVAGWITHRHKADDHKYDVSGQWQELSRDLRAENAEIRNEDRATLLARFETSELEAENCRLETEKWRQKADEWHSKYLLALSVSTQQTSVIAELEQQLEFQAKQIEALEKAVKSNGI